MSHATVVLYNIYFVLYTKHFTVGVALIKAMSTQHRGGVDNNATISINAISNYSYVTLRGINYEGVEIAHCVTGLGPNGTDDNAALGSCYFNGTRIPFVGCGDSSSAIVQPRIARNIVGVINIVECREITTDVEGIYTCVIMNSSMIHESIRFGVYFDGRSELLDKHYAFHHSTMSLSSHYTKAPPVIDTPSSSTVTAAIGSLLTLSCTSRGSPPDTFTWMNDDDSTVLQSTNITVVNLTSTSAVFRADYSIDNVTTSDSGVYTCNVTNPMGNDTDIITVVVNCKLLILHINNKNLMLYFIILCM